MTQKSGLIQSLAYLVLLAAVLLLFYRFTIQNSARIEERTEIYAQESALQTVTRIYDQFHNAQDLIDTYAFFLENMLQAPDINPELLAEMEANSPFDAVRFSKADGVSIGPDGHAANTADRNFFIRGMEGQHGVSVIMQSRTFNQPIITFFAPIRHDGKVIGVLHGAFLAGKYLRRILESPYFGTPADVFLCNNDGAVIASSGYAHFSGHVIENLLKIGAIDDKVAQEGRAIYKAVSEGNSPPDTTVDNLSILRLPHYDYILVQAFPKSVTSAIIHNANTSSLELEFSLMFLFAAFAIFHIIRSSIQKKRLEKQNLEFSWVISGMETLFNRRYVLLNLETCTYAYIAGGEPSDETLPSRGDYADVIHYLGKNLADEEGRENYRQFFRLDRMKTKFAKRDFVVYECHSNIDGNDIWENLIVICIARGDNGSPLRLLLVRQNVTDLKQRELRARKRLSVMDRKDRQYRVAVTANALCVYEFNVTRDLINEDVTTEVNDTPVSLLQLAGLKAPCKASDAFAGWLPMILPESRDDYLHVLNIEHMCQSYEQNHRELDVDYWAMSPDGKEICVRQAIYLALDAMSGDIMAMSIVRDITAQVTRQRMQTRALQDALMQAQHANEAKTTFLSNMSHDIRTPMNAIIGFATIAASHLDNKAQVRDCLQKVLSSSNHLLSLINDILDMSRIESGKMQIKEQECNISEMMHNLVNIIQPQVKAKQLQLFIDTYEVTNEDVIADPLKMNQVFINLLSNAVKYTPAGGVISFSIRQTPAFRHGYADYLFEVRDNGIGMSDEFRRHIFEPFTRESTTTISGIQGTGLGMAITKNIIELMNGSITVESTPGEGSVFRISLTLRIQDAARTNEDLEELRGLRVLVVDDDFHICDSVDKMLHKIGLRSEWTTSGREAAYRARRAWEEGDPYHTFIIDWQMPGMNGVETTRSIRRIVGDATTIIILTAYEWADIEDEAREAGVTAFCAKPLFMSDLKNALLSSHRKGKEGEKEKTEQRDFGGKRILLVDDLELNREVAEFILTESGFEVETAPDGSDAVEMVRKSREGWYDAILMDVQMPTMNGYEATRDIRALDREDVKTMPIIAMTANALEEDKAQALKSGMNAHIAKPLDIRNFFEVLGNFFQKG